MVSKIIVSVVCVTSFFAQSIIGSMPIPVQGQPQIIYVQTPTQNNSGSFLGSVLSWTPYIVLAGVGYSVYDHWHNDGKKTRALITTTKDFLHNAYQEGTKKILELVSKEHKETREHVTNEHDATRDQMHERFDRVEALVQNQPAKPKRSNVKKAKASDINPTKEKSAPLADSFKKTVRSVFDSEYTSDGEQE